MHYCNSKKLVLMKDSDLVFDDERINRAIAKIKIPDYLKNKGSAWIIKNKVRQNGKHVQL